MKHRRLRPLSEIFDRVGAAPSVARNGAKFQAKRQERKTVENHRTKSVEHQNGQLGNRLMHKNGELGGGFKYFLFSPLLGEDSHFD